MEIVVVVFAVVIAPILYPLHLVVGRVKILKKLGG